jgi:hypothetical protein
MIENTNLNIDIHRYEDYISLYLAEDEEIFSYEYKEGDNTVSFLSIKRRINLVSGLEIDETLYDLETPYGYGGPISNTLNEAFLEKGFYEYKKHCEEKNIVCEFIRFNPFSQMYKYEGYYDFLVQDRNVVVVDLDMSMEDVRKHYSKTTRNIIRNKKVDVVTIKSDENINGFIKLYSSAMDAKSASDFYLFSNEYLTILINKDYVDLISIYAGGVLVSSGMFLYGDISYYHLSANNMDYAQCNGNYHLLDAAFERAKEQGSSRMILGGGMSSSNDDSLLKFKSKFSKSYAPYFIGGLTFMPTKMEYLNGLWRKQNKNENKKQFQLYRL